MKIQRHEHGIKLFLSPRDTYYWAHKPGAAWPCSTIADRRLFAEFDNAGNLVDMALDSGRGNQDCDGNEFNAITSDFIKAGE